MFGDKQFEGMSKEEEEETKEILDEIGEDGAEEEPSKEEPAKEDEKPEPEKAEEKPEEKPEEEPKAEPKEEEPEPESDEDEDDGEPDEVVPARKERPFKTVSAYKYGKLKDRFDNLKEEVEEIKQSSTRNQTDKVADISDVVKQFSEELGVEAGLVQKFAESISGQAKLPPEVEKMIQGVAEKESWNKEEELFSKELKKLSDDFPNEKIDKDKLHEIAFTKGYADKSLFELHFRHLKPTQAPAKKKTSESAKGGTKKGDSLIDFDNVSDEDVAGMSDKEFDEYSDYMGQKQSSKTTYDNKGNRIN